MIAAFGFTVWFAAVTTYLVAVFRLRAKGVREGSFVVGDEEWHQVTYRWRQHGGMESIDIDGRQFESRRVPFSFALSQTISVLVGERERHLVVVTRSRKRWFGALRWQLIEAQCDGVPVHIAWKSNSWIGRW